MIGWVMRVLVQVYTRREVEERERMGKGRINCTNLKVSFCLIRG